MELCVRLSSLREMVWLDPILIGYYFIIILVCVCGWVFRQANAQSPFNEHLLMRCQNENPSKITIKCLLLSNQIHFIEKWMLAFVKMKEKTTTPSPTAGTKIRGNKQSWSRVSWISIQIHHFQRIKQHSFQIKEERKKIIYLFQNQKKREMNTQIRLQQEKTIMEFFFFYLALDSRDTLLFRMSQDWTWISLLWISTFL